MKRMVVLFLIVLNSHLFGQIPEESSFKFTTPELAVTSNPEESRLRCKSYNTRSRKFDELFMPLPTSGVTVINVNLIFVQRDNGTGNFQAEDVEHQAIIDEWMAIINDRFSSIVNTTSSDCNSNPDKHTFIPDSKISFEFSRIYIRDSNGWNNNRGNLCPDSPNWYLKYLDDQIIANPSYSRGINVFFTEDSTNYANLVENQSTTANKGQGQMCAHYPTSIDFTRSSRIHVPDRFSKYWWMKNICPSIYNQPWDPIIRSWYLDEAVAIGHEIGHCLNLYHHCPGYYSLNTCGEALMYQKHDGSRNYIPPIEVGRMHAAIALTNVRTFAHETYNPVPLSISQPVDFNIETKLLQSIHINTGGVLSISCDMFVLPEVEIRIKQGGKCIIEESIINSTGTKFKGIVIENNAYLELKSFSMSNHDIIVQSGGALKISNSLNISGNSKIVVEAGGFICIENNTNINLVDGLSVIVLKNGFNSGVNTSVVDDPGTCELKPENITITGNGSINPFTNDI